MREYFVRVKNKFNNVYTSCKDKISSSALALKNKIPAQSREILSRPFRAETREFIRQSPETQRMLKIALTANVLYASTAMVNQFNSYLLNDNAREEEFSVEQYGLYMAYITNNLLWLFVVRKSIRMLIETTINSGCIYKAVSIDHPNAHHQQDCKKKHPNIQEIHIPPEQVNIFFRPYYEMKQQVAEIQRKLAEIRYILSVISGSIASGVYFAIDMQAITMLTAYLPFSQQIAFVLRALVIGHSLPEYNYANQCTEHRHAEVRKLNLTSTTIGVFSSILVEALTYSLGGNPYVRDAIANMIYQYLIAVIMSKPLSGEEEGTDYFYYNRAIACALMEVSANKIVNLIKESGYSLELCYEMPPKEIESKKIYLYLKSAQQESEQKQKMKIETMSIVNNMKNEELEYPQKEKNSEGTIIKDYEPKQKIKSDIEEEKKETEWLEYAIQEKTGEMKIIKIETKKLGEHFESIKAVLKSKGEIKTLAKADEKALFVITTASGHHKSIVIKFNEAKNSQYIKLAKQIFISSDLQSLDEFVRKPDIKRYLDYNESIFQKVISVLEDIRGSFLAQVGNQLPGLVTPTNLQNIKKVLEVILFDKTDVVLDMLRSFLFVRTKHLNELEAHTVFKLIHAPERLAEISAKTNTELNVQVEQRIEKKSELLHMEIVEDYYDNELVKKTNMTTEDEAELFSSLNGIEKTVKSDDISKKILDATTSVIKLSVFPSKTEDATKLMQPQQTVSPPLAPQFL